MDSLQHLPPWAQMLAQRYYTKTVSTFLLHGAVRDLQPLGGGERPRRFGTLKTFLSEELFPERDHVLFFDRSSGIGTGSPKTQQDLARVMTAYDAVSGTDFARSYPRDPGRALQILENYVRSRLGDGKSVALVLDFAETLVPAGDLGGLSTEDRFVLTTLVKWAQDPQLLTGNFSVVLVAESLSDISPRISRNPYVALVELPLPGLNERLEYIHTKTALRPLSDYSEVTADVLAQMTAGLSRIHLDRLLTQAMVQSQRITLAALKEKKKEIIQAECHGLLEFIEPSHTLDVVAGHGPAKHRLRQSAQALKQGRLEVLPMGYLISGPVGTGKTFLATCFAGEIGIPCVKFLNFRSQWQGVTESNLEKIFTLLKALWPVAVMIDEADAFLGQRDSSGDSGTSSRVFASIASFMGNTEYRGKILWFLLTCRPDLLPIDLKRQGRAEEHLGLFYPQSDAERDELFRVVAKKIKVTDALPPFSSLAPGQANNISGADIEAVLVRAKFLAVADRREAVTADDVKAVLEDFVPPSYPLEIELQNLVAVQECTSRKLLPETFRQMDREKVTERIRALKLILEER